MKSEDSTLLAGADGMPAMTASQRNDNETNASKMIPLLLIIPLLLGLAIATIIWKWGNTALYEKKLLQLAAHDLHYYLLACVIVSRTVVYLNLYPMSFKSRVMPAAAANIRANMFIYQVMGDNAPQGKVVLVEEGDLGMYNRANRSVGHFVENMAPFLLNLLPATYMCPFPSLMLALVFCLGRIVHQTGYAKHGYGGHGFGFMLSNLFSSCSLEGLVLLGAIKGFGWSASGLCASNDVTGVAPSSLSSASSTFDSDGRPESGRLKLSDSWPVAQTLLKSYGCHLYHLEH
eukprot:g24371.t1